VSSWLSVASEAIVRDTEVRFGEQIAEQVDPSPTDSDATPGTEAKL